MFKVRFICGLVFLLIVAGVVSPVYGQTARWQSRGIGGGGALYSCSISPHNPSTLFMATDMSGVFRSNNFGLSWFTLDFGQLRGGVDTAVRFTSHPNVLYAIHIGRFGERIPVRSGNGGASFIALPGDPTGGEVFTLLADPNTSSRLLLASWDRLYFSNNSGASFREVFSAVDSGNGLHLAGAFWDGTRIYVGTNLGLVVSSNNGATFSKSSLTGIPANESFVSFAGAKLESNVRLFGVTFPSSNVWGGITAAEVVDAGNTPKVYRLNVGSGNWVKVRDHNSATVVKPFFVGMANNDISTVYIAGFDTDMGAPAVLKSTNAGGNWTSVFLSDNNQNIATGWMGDGGDLAWYWSEVALGFAVSPNNSSRLMMTDYGFVHVSDTGGQTWKQAYVKPYFQNPAGQLINAGKDYATTGVEQTSCWWIEWAAPGILLAGFSDIHGIRSTNSGSTWVSGRTLGLPHNSTYHVVKQPTTSRLFAATSSVHDLYQSTYLQDSKIDGGTGMIVRSLDLGASWQPFFDFGHPVVWLTFDPANANRMFASVVHRTAGGIYVCNNIGATTPQFSRLSNPPRTEGHPLCLRILNDGSLVASYSGRRDASGQFTTSSGVFLSTNQGQSWQDRTAAQMTRWTKDVVIDPHDATQNTWYAAVFSHWGSHPNEVGGLYRSTNRGQTWTELGDFYRVESIAIDPSNPNRAFVTTEADGLWRTSNLQSTSPTFQLDPSYPFQHPVRVFFDPGNINEPWATSFGGGLRILTAR